MYLFIKQIKVTTNIIIKFYLFILIFFRNIFKVENGLILHIKFYFILFCIFFWETFSQLRNQFRGKEKKEEEEDNANRKEIDSVSFLCINNGWTTRSYTLDAFSCSTNPSLSMEAPSRFSIFLFQRRTSTGLHFPNQNPNFTTFIQEFEFLV